MAARQHDSTKPGCADCNPTSQDKPELCNCVEDGYTEAIKRWHASCPCCFSDKYPGGLDAALAEVRA